MGAMVLPSSLRSPRRGAASATSASRACATRPRLDLDPAGIGISGAAAAATTNGSKRPCSSREHEPPTKRRRAGGDAAAKNPPMSLVDKNGVNQLLLSLLPPGRSPRQVNPLPDLVVRCLQENGTMCCAGGEDDETEIEIDVHSLGDEALWAIKNRVGAYLDGIARRDAVWSQRRSKEGFVGQSTPRSIPAKSFPSQAASESISSKAASKIIPFPSKAASKTITIPAQAALKGIPPRAAPRSTQLTAVSKCMPPSKDASKIIPCQAVSKSIPPQATLKGIPPRAALTSNKHAVSSRSILSRALLKEVSPKAVPLLPAPPKPSGSREFVSELVPVKAATSQSTLRSSQPTSSSSLPASAKPTKSMKELIADADKHMKEVVRRWELQELRAAARRRVEQMVKTVEFNDPYLDVQDAFK